MTTLATEQWSATSSTAWPAQWFAAYSQGTVSVSGGLGVITANNGGYKVTRRTLAGLAASTGKRRITGTVRLANLVESTVIVSGREVVNATGYYPTGYFLGLAVTTTGASWKLGAGFGTGWYGPYTDSSAAGTAVTIAAGNTLGYTVEVEGYTIRARMWNVTAGQSEPTTWQATYTDADTSVPSGSPALGMTNGNTGNQVASFGPVTVTDGVDGAAYTATSAPSVAATIAASGTANIPATAPVSSTATITPTTARAGTSPATSSATVGVAASAVVQRVAAATVTTATTPAAGTAQSMTAATAVTTGASVTGTPSRGSATTADLTVTATPAASSSRAGTATASIASATTTSATATRTATETVSTPIGTAIAGIPSRGMSADATIGVGLDTAGPARGDLADDGPVTADLDVLASGTLIITDTAAVHIAPVIAATTGLGAYDDVEIVTTLEPSATATAAGTDRAAVEVAAAAAAAPGDIPPGTATFTVEVGITARTRAAHTATATIAIPLAVTADPSGTPTGSATLTVDTLLTAAAETARRTPATVATAIGLDAAARAARAGTANVAVVIGITARAETDDPNPIIRITARLRRRPRAAAVTERTRHGRIPARTRKGSIVNRYPYGTREFVAVEVKDGDTPVTAGVEFAVVKGTPADTAWTAAEIRSGEIGFILDEDVLPGTWSVFARYTHGDDRPVVDCGTITVSGRVRA